MEPNQNNNPKDGKSGGDKRLKRLLLTLIISVAIILLFSSVFNNVSNSQYTETTLSDFLDAKNARQLTEVEIRSDRIVYMTIEESEKPASQQKAFFTGPIS